MTRFKSLKAFKTRLIPVCPKILQSLLAKEEYFLHVEIKGLNS